MFTRGHRRSAKLWLLLAALSAGPLLFPAPAEIPYEWTGIERVVAVADLHGDYDRFVFILAHPQIDLVDADLHWKGGRAHLVQLGDVMDRGPRAKDILDLLMRLEKEAAEAGGAVHVLLGNHEEMNITGIALDYPGYVTVEQFLDFLPAAVRREKDEAYFKTLPPDDQILAEIDGLDVTVNEGYAAYWRRIIASKNGETAQAYVKGFNDVYGRWLAQKNTVIRINDVIYAHGGLSEALSRWPLREINQVMRTELEFFRGRMRDPQSFAKPFRPRLVYDPESPLWFRGLATKDEKAAQAEIDRTLANLGARAMVIGHNYFRFSGATSPVIQARNVSRFQDKVWIMDTGISGSYGGVPSALIYDRGGFKVWGETEELAARSGIHAPPPKPMNPRETEAFLQAARVLERGPGTGGRTDAWRLVLESQGAVLRAVFKYIDRRRPDPLADSYRYDLAAYVLSKYLGLACVPPTVERTLEEVPGAVQAFVADARALPDYREQKPEVPDPGMVERALDELTVFQALVYDDCRNERDTLVTGNGRVFRVDFSEAFAPVKGDPPGCRLLRCSRLLFGRLLAWDERRVARYLGRYLDKDELEALNARRDLVVRRIRMNIRSLGESNVLF